MNQRRNTNSDFEGAISRVTAICRGVLVVISTYLILALSGILVFAVATQLGGQSYFHRVLVGILAFIWLPLHNWWTGYALTFGIGGVAWSFIPAGSQTIAMLRAAVAALVIGVTIGACTFWLR